MEVREKAKIVITVASLVAVTVLFVAEYRRRHRKKQTSSSLSSCYLHSELKSQFGFKRVLADNSYSEFKHLKLDDASSSLENSSNGHPYETEITVLLENPRIEFGFLRGEYSLEMSDSYVWVETELQLKELAEILAKEKVFAVDTEQHSLRSFLGFTALIQISTHEKDFLVDTIVLHDAMSILRPVFSEPNICKVFHGADNDVLWLQRDFHIYVVNMFDTAKACEVLSKPQRSLAYLLETVCGVATNKLLQREDWRQRPLSEEMVRYARTDAHYLLYIADSLTAELKQLATDSSSPDDRFHFLLEASRRSNMTCLQLYTKETEDFPGSAAASSIIYRHLNGHGDKSNISLNAEELVRKLCAWRDLMGRIHDESTRYVLSDQAIVGLACKQPTTNEEIYDTIAHTDLATESSPSLSSSVQSPYPVICSHLDDIYEMILDKLAKLDDILPVVLKKCLGTNGTCPISVFNYSLLVNFKTKLSSHSAPKQNGHKNFKQQFTRKASRELFVKKFSCKAPVYHNCRIYANDGRLLCYCDKRKLEWYLNRGLAKLVEENPPAIMLLFEPKGRPEDEGNDFYIQTKRNICVGCGEGKHYLRYRIIPSCYRVHFPEHLKSHRSHDIVLLCVDCHEVAHAAAERYKKQIATEFGIPLFVRRVLDSKEAQGTSSLVEDESTGNSEDAGVSPLHLRSAAMALLRHGNRMPSSRREELLQTVKMYYGGRDISEEDLEKALLIGLSPHERRKLERKKGVSFKHSAEVAGMDKQEGNHIISIGQDEYNDGEAPAYSEKIMNVERSTVADDSGDGTSEGDGASELNDTQCNGNTLHQQNSKLSLLGHGPHGKQIVEYILREHGEDGVRDFCQRWRKVFVDAVHPRHLPGGWNVSHSGRRDFGEFSVYNPTKRLSTE
ncbi:protein RRP6-like 3 isoform X2 [Arabidopsis lyrata subsp. lyrata]|uniref:protein RRP6-like 3 isoform X2 n=1 Tax=Arabidopsis lyrata subsp. lyrata TaxID=81972 RepID=UPI000A29C9CD|nr:protein RRP6-like 3 isoform X2 [Arabidopsis lyrata subsp. lyrata]|eukprot:XP_020884168.1 protein RRP6-like 3 isoform X2 [Arabidopsis lyrata subsp. lyrata]